MFAKVEERHSREFIHTPGVVGKQCFLIDFGINFLPVGTPGASRAPFSDQVLFQTDFYWLFRCPGDALWGPGGSFGRPGACLEATLGVTRAPKVTKKIKKKVFWCTQCVRISFEYEKGAARQRRMWLNHNKYYLLFSYKTNVLAKALKVTPGAPKSSFLTPFVILFGHRCKALAPLWAQSCRGDPAP